MYLFSSLVTHVVFEYTAVVFIDLMHFNLREVWVHFSVSVRHSEDSRLPGQTAILPPGLHVGTLNSKCTFVSRIDAFLLTLIHETYAHNAFEES